MQITRPENKLKLLTHSAGLIGGGDLKQASFTHSLIQSIFFRSLQKIESALKPISGRSSTDKWSAVHVGVVGGLQT